MTDQLTTLEVRMSLLERQHHRLKSLLVLVVVLACVPYILGAQATSDTIRASRIEVMNNGRAVVVLRADGTGGRVELFQNNGTQAGYLISSANGTSLDLRDEAGKLVGWQDALEQTGAGLCLRMPDATECGLYASAEAIGGRMTTRDAADRTRTFP